MRRFAAALCAALMVATLAGCGEDDDRIEVGEEFSWDDFTIEEGWEIKSVTRSTGLEEVVTPEITGTIVNNSSEERAAIFQVVLLHEEEPVATVNCTSPTMIEDQSMQFLCPGLNAVMPENYDSVRVQEFTRDVDRDDSAGT